MYFMTTAATFRRNQPVEVDTQLAEIHGRWSTLVIRAQNCRHQAHKDWALAEAVRLEAEAAVLAAEMDALEEQYTGWSRAFVVADGHVHSSMNCSTCNNGTFLTEFGWVTEMSGKTEAEIIEAAGSRACTVCYPNAPVDAPAGRIFHATEIEAQKAREERAAKRVAAAAKKAANAIGPYLTSERDRIETVYAAKAYLTDGFEWGWSHPSFSLEDRDAIAGLLAAKNGTTPEKELEAAAKRAANRG